MDIQILQLLDGARMARGLTVVIDVFRAFTVECYAFAAGVSEILPVGDLDLAYRLKKQHPDCVLVGERNGLKCPGFDCGNSPSGLMNLTLAGKIMVHTTSAGTQGLVNASHATQILTGSLVNARAIAAYIRQQNPSEVSLVCMGLSAKTESEEDTLCAWYIRQMLEGNHPDIQAQISHLANTSGKKFFDPAQQDAFPQPDFALCVQQDIFPFVLQATKHEDGLYHIRRIPVSDADPQPHFPA